MFSPFCSGPNSSETCKIFGGFISEKKNNNIFLFGNARKNLEEYEPGFRAIKVSILSRFFCFFF